MANYFEIFDDTRAGILSALERAVTEAHAWEFLRYWEPEWEMVPLPSIEQRLPNLDAYDPDIYNECVEIIWTIARTDWLEWRESYIEENPPCTCRQRAGKLAGCCWPRELEYGESAMCEEIRNYSELFPDDNERATRLMDIDNAITARADWEYWGYGMPDSWEPRASTYGVEGITEEDMEVISEVARLGWHGYVRTRDLELAAYLDEWRPVD